MTKRIIHYAHNRAEIDRFHRHYIAYSADQETEEILRDPDMMEQIRKSEEDMREGRARNADEVFDELFGEEGYFRGAD